MAKEKTTAKKPVAKKATTAPKKKAVKKSTGGLGSKGLSDISVSTGGQAAIFGEGVDALLESIQKDKGEKIKGFSEARLLPVNDIHPNPYQPRQEFDQKGLEELAESIATHGVFNPILVVTTVNGYDLVAGERRLRASKIAKQTTIPAIIVEFDDKQMAEVSLLENIQREDLNVIEVAHALNSLIEKYGYTQEVLAKQVGKSREYVTNTLRLLKLPKEIQEMVGSNKLPMGHARAILSLDNKEDMILVAKQAVKEKLTTRATENLVKAIKNPYVDKKGKTQSSTTNYDGVVKMMQERLQTKVDISDTQITIKYSGVNDLNRILEILDLLEEEE